MLLSQNFCWRHQRTLRTTTNNQQQTNKSNNSFTTAYIALKQPVHLLAWFYIGINFFDHFLLRIRQLERKFLFVKPVEEVTEVFENKARNFFVTEFEFENAELTEKQFFKNKRGP